MSASDLHPIGLVPKTRLAPLFDEEASRWALDLTWDFEPTRKRLESAHDEGRLRGLVASDDQGPCAYATYTLDEGQGVVGSFCAGERARGRGFEAFLVHGVLKLLLAHRPLVIDCQTLFSSDPDLLTPFSSLGFDSATRIYMTLDRSAWLAAKRAPPGPLLTTEIHEFDLDSVARLVHAAHLDSRRLDASSSFDSLESCERILRQIIQDDICGPFDPRGSTRVATSGETVALALLTWPLPGVAHISEVATAPAHRRKGLARQCLAETLRRAFEGGGARAATLSVTASNQAALTLYASLGFVSRLHYKSHVLRLEPEGHTSRLGTKARADRDAHG